MEDENKTKKQLIDESKELRQRIAELEKSEAKGGNGILQSLKKA
jgi:uncharacterized protein YdcH (DUF465 family)